MHLLRMVRWMIRLFTLKLKQVQVHVSWELQNKATVHGEIYLKFNVTVAEKWLDHYYSALKDETQPANCNVCHSEISKKDKVQVRIVSGPVYAICFSYRVGLSLIGFGLVQFRV